MDASKVGQVPADKGGTTVEVLPLWVQYEGMRVMRESWHALNGLNIFYEGNRH